MTRLFWGPLSRTPRGIDRVELALANELFSSTDRLVFGVLPTAWGTRIFDAAKVLKGLRELEAMWAENAPTANDPRLVGLVERMSGNLDVTLATGKPMSRLKRASRMMRLLRATGFSFGRSARALLPKGAVYVNIGQILLAAPFLLRWLRKRPDVVPVFMLHDVIPLDTPHYVAPSSVRYHGIMIESAARYARGLIVTTEHARVTVGAAIARFRTGAIPTLVQGLPVADVFRRSVASVPPITETQYFVVCGSIEPRKNHLLLLDVWRKLVEENGEAAPHLVIVGSPGWRGADILGEFEACEDTRRHIHPVSGLSSPALTRLLQGATALLMPSLNEGFGLPVIEAMKLGVPVVVSDIPAHREVAGPGALFLPTDDILGWAETITSCCGRQLPRLTEAELPEFSSPTDYAKAVAKFLDRCAGMETPASHQPRQSPDRPSVGRHHITRQDLNPALD